MKKYFLLSTLALIAGLAISFFINIDTLLVHPIYNYLTYTLLAIGLYGAVYGIDIKELAGLKKQVLVVVTLGVVLKIAFIGSILYLITGSLISFLLACIVAQIDPLAIAKLTQNPKNKLSNRAESLLKAWASFDDPMTILIAFYLLLPLLVTNQSNISTYFLNLFYNLFFAGIVYLFNYFVLKQKFQFILLITSLIVGISFQYMLGIALIALFLRPKISLFHLNFYSLITNLTSSAYYISVIILGILVSKGVDLKTGIILGILAFLSQFLVTYILLGNFDKSDKIKLSLTQYNGITSIILSSLIVVYYSQTVAIISVAIVTISVLYFSANSLIQANNV